jgi:CheY-like chemotaxis protein
LDVSFIRLEQMGLGQRDLATAAQVTESMSLRILVVDDEPAALRLIKALVEPLGYEVLSLTDSRQAAEVVNRQKLDAVFVDVQMPGLDGFELTKLIRASRSNSTVPIVMTAELDEVDTMRRGFKAGVTFFLNKPFNPDKLRGLLLTLRSAILKERRRNVRLPFQATVTCRWGEKQSKLISANISECGMLLESLVGLEPGQEIDSQFMLPLGQVPLKPRAKIVRKEPPDRVGVVFLGLTPQDQEAVRKFISHGLKE